MPPLIGGKTWEKNYFYNYLFFCLPATSIAVAHIAVSRVCLEVVPSRYTGTFIGVFGAAVCLGKIAFAGLFDVLLHGDLFMFFSCTGVLFAVILGSCYLLLYPTVSDRKKDSNNGSPEEKALVWTEEGDIKNILCSRSFHMTFWSTTAFSSIGFTLMNNITSITNSVGVTDTFEVVTAMSISIMVTGALYGKIYDKMASNMSGFLLLFTTYFSLVVGLLLGMFTLNRTTSYIFTVLSGFAMGPSFSLPVAMFVTEFGRPTYSFVSGCLSATVALCQVILQLVMGYLYDLKNAGPEDAPRNSFCYGPDCFFSPFVVLLSLTSCVIFVQFVNLCSESEGREEQHTEGGAVKPGT